MRRDFEKNWMEIRPNFRKDDYLKRSILKRFSAVIVITAVLFTTVMSVSLFAGAASSGFTARLSAPGYSNKYYFDDDYNVFYASGYGMPNCTAYAYGRAYEILGKEPKLSWASAGYWYDYNRSNGYYKYGKTPKVGAIACWSYSGGGHVAVVEQIDSNGAMTLSNSAYNRDDLFFYLTYARTGDANPGGNSWWNFQGYIYLIDDQVPATTKATQPATKATQATTVDHTSSYHTGIYQTTGTLNFRTGAGVSYQSVAMIKIGTQLAVTKTYKDGGYNWGQVTYNGKTGWIALEYTKYLAKQWEDLTPVTTAATKPTEDTKPAGNIVGDINRDGNISIVDATLMQQYLARMIQMTSTQLKLADFDGNGRVTIDDVTALQRYLAKI